MSADQHAPTLPPLVSFLVSLALACAVHGRSTTMRIAFPLVIYLDRRYLRHHFCTFSRYAVDFQVAAQQCYPLTHAGETQTLARPTPVGDLLRGGGSMLVDVGESLLRDSEKRCLDLGGQTLVSQCFLVVDLGAFATDLLDLQADGGRQPKIVECGWPEVGYDIPGLADRLLHQLQSPGEVFAALL